MKEKKREIKAIIFDVEGVLQIAKNKTYQTKLHTNMGVHEKISKKLKIPLDNYFDYLDEDYSLSIEGKLSKSKLLSNLSKRLNYPKEKLEKIYSKAYSRRYRKNRFLLRLAEKFKKRGFKIAILSDQWHLSSPALIPEKFYKIFNPIVTSCSAGVRKPNPKIYKILLKKLKTKPEESLFIDDREWNLPPAQKFGINTIWFTGNKTLKTQIKDFGIKI